MTTQPAQSVGLGGDGDEVHAIRDVEAAFGVKLDYRDAPNWVTAGHVFASLCNALPADEAAKPDLWERFAEALANETGADPKTIQPESPLLSHSRFGVVAGNALALVFAGGAIAVLIGLLWVLWAI
jgi:hypothetical protein